MNCHVGSKTQTQIFWKSSQCSQWLSQFPKSCKQLNKTETISYLKYTGEEESHGSAWVCDYKTFINARLKILSAVFLSDRKNDSQRE